MRTIAQVLVPVLLFSMVPALGGADEEPRVFIGEVVEVRDGVSTSDGQTWSEVTVRQRNGDRARLRLGRTAEAPPCRVGDMVRARVMAGGPQGGAYQVRNMRNRRTGECLRLRDGEGCLRQTRSQMRARARIHEPGTGGCTGNGAGTGGRRGGRGGRS